MRYKIPQNCPKSDLINAPLPNHGSSYAVISHEFVIDSTLQLLNQNGFKVVKENYRATKDGSIAQGIYYIEPMQYDQEISNETELGLMFAWTNSYNKLVRFQCGIGAYVTVCNNGMVSGEMSFARKHKGSAAADIIMQISMQIGKAKKVFKDLIYAKDSLKGKTLSIKEQSQILGRLFYEKDILDPSHLSAIKTQMNDPSYDYNCPMDNAWTFYNHVTHVFKELHPKKWMANTMSFHEFMMAELFSSNNNEVVVENNISEVIETPQVNISEEAVEVSKEQIVEEIFDDFSKFDFDL